LDGRDGLRCWIHMYHTKSLLLPVSSRRTHRVAAVIVFIHAVHNHLVYLHDRDRDLRRPDDPFDLDRHRLCISNRIHWTDDSGDHYYYGRLVHHGHRGRIVLSLSDSHDDLVIGIRRCSRARTDSMGLVHASW